MTDQAMISRVDALGTKLRRENGVARAIEFIEEQLSRSVSS